MVKAVFPGTFDPPTLGHCNIIERVAPLFGEVVVIIAENRRKAQLFSPAERLDLLTELVAAYPTVSVMLCDSLIVHCMKRIDARVIIRGIRGIADFSYEEEIALVNRLLEPGIETFFITADPACRTAPGVLRPLPFLPGNPAISHSWESQYERDLFDGAPLLDEFIRSACQPRRDLADHEQPVIL
ncbi:MAG: pantetheine-phosphate adenylyltransferase [Candidatus Methanoplasma sp.]|nr:pantetheine-phosphate adenylyltransferase [Candidatus Methanoplasma sp.]